MRLLVISHSSATPLNRLLYTRICSLTGWHLSLVVPAKWQDEFGNVLDDPAIDGPIDLHQLPVFANGNVILHGYKASIAKFIRQTMPSLIYVNHEPYAVATAQVCWANINTANVPFGFYSCQNIQKSYPPPFSWCEKMVYQNSAFAFPITNAVSEVLAHKGYIGSRTVCALPLDPEKYNPHLRGSPPSDFPVTTDHPVLGFVGRLTEAKGLRTLAKALVKIADLSWSFVVIGTGEFQEEFKKLLKIGRIDSRVTFAGFVPHEETPRWMASLDVLVLPSETQQNWKEQFGRVIPEALACGAAIVGSDSGEIPHLIRQSGGGLVFPERDSDALAQALRMMITQPRRRAEMASAGRAWVIDNISLEAVAKRMISTFESAINESGIVSP